MAKTDAELPVKGDVIASKYLIEGTLGAGGMGAVFEVSHRVTGKRFAVKYLLPSLTAESDAVKRFIREAQVAGRVDHPNVVEVYDVGQEGESFFMVMELLQGEALSDRLEKAGRMQAAVAARIMVCVAQGVAAAHVAGVIHRDLKPDNIFLCHGSEGGPEIPKVLDFGISKMTYLAGEVTSSITRAGTVMGTPHYMAPEQVRGLNVDERTDVYALGVILYQMLTNTLPFPGDTYSDLILKIMTEAPKPLSSVAPATPPGLVKLVEKAMSRDPAARFATVGELGKALAPFGMKSGSQGVWDRDSDVAGSGAHQAHHDNPLSDSKRLPTPLSTESNRIATGPRGVASGPHPQQKSTTGLMIGIGVLAAALVTGGVFVVRMMGGDDKPAAAANSGSTPGMLEPKTPEAKASAAKPAANSGSGSELPKIDTVRIAPDPNAPERMWQPPAGSTEAPRPMDDAQGHPVAEPDKAHDEASGELAIPGPDGQPIGKPIEGKKSTHASHHATTTTHATTPSGDRPDPQPRSVHRTFGMSMDDF